MAVTPVCTDSLGETENHRPAVPPIFASRFLTDRLSLPFCNDPPRSVPPPCYDTGMARRAFVVDWNGQDLPSELRELPAGRYVVEAVDDAAFNDDEARGIELALEQYHRGQTVEATQARKIFDALLKK